MSDRKLETPQLPGIDSRNLSSKRIERFRLRLALVSRAERSPNPEPVYLRLEDSVSASMTRRTHV